jgi:hypothetical protein
MRHSRLIPVVLAAVLSSAAVAAAEPPHYREYVALGDSWSADSTIMPTRISTRFVPFGCAQSVGDYPKQVAAGLGITNFQDATCGSATTVELTAPQNVPLAV